MIIDQKGRHGQRLDLTRMFEPVALQRSKIIATAEFREQVLKDFPVAFAGGTDPTGVLSTSIGKTICWKCIIQSSRYA